MDERGQFVVRGIDAVAKLAQRLEQGGLRTFVHARHAVQPIHAFTETDHCREEARCRARVADEEFERPSFTATARNLATLAIDGDGAVAAFVRVLLHVDHEAELLKAVHHHLRVLAPERALQGCFTARERGEHECAVRDALGAGHGDGRADGLRERDDFDEVGQGHGS